MSVMEYIEPYLGPLGLAVGGETREALERWCGVMLADPLYPSVSKIREPEEIATKHVLDALAPLGTTAHLPCWKGADTILDIGTGGGFPAVPLAIALPNSRVYAMDAKGKAVDFVGRMKSGAGIGNLEPVLARAEELGRDPAFREKMDLVVTRAVASVRILLELCLPLVRVGGYLLLYKGPALQEELAEAGKAMQVLGVRVDAVRTFTFEPPLLPFTRGYVLIRKSAPVPAAYPRRNGVPASHPL
ncbi:MAG TPA: 16S rRNA (guanine(527)-N(7))-methyltransferase RsmG [Candidatus Ozemobacteraceae bacterium]|nr:16S rRNA (guanine(527)-N(7))-methyltransferase RsmG [Candidatus Ozemobacteraceae bacterium]